MFDHTSHGPMLFIKIPMATAHMHKDVDVILMGIPADRLFKNLQQGA